MEKVKDAREELQSKAVMESSIHPLLILEFATGVGKTRALLKCIEASSSPKKWLIVVPELNLIENFKKDAIKHGYKHLLGDKIEDVICYASLKNYSNTSFNLGLDECHHISEMRGEIIQDINYDQIIGLSATLPKNVQERLFNLGKFHIFTVDVNEAIALGILPEPNVKVVYVQLDDHFKDYVIKTKKGNKKVSALSYYLHLNKNIKYWKGVWKDKGFDWAKLKYMRAALDRKNFLASYKTKQASKILTEFRKDQKRFICFTGSVKQAEQLGGKKSVHSKNSKNDNEEIISAFNSKSSNEIFANQMLREGMNLEDIDEGLIIQLDGNEKSGVQMQGRIYRSVSPKLTILVVRSTKDEDYLKTFLSTLDDKYVNHIK